MWTLVQYEQKKIDLIRQLKTVYSHEEVDRPASLKRIDKKKEVFLIRQIKDLENSKGNEKSKLLVFLSCLFMLQHWRKWGGHKDEDLNLILHLIDTTLSLCARLQLM